MSQLTESQPFTLLSSPTDQDRMGSHEYSSHRAAQIWNFVRILRLSLNNLVMNHLTSTEQARLEPRSAGVWFPLDAQSLERYIISNIASLTHDVCASVPYFLRPMSFNDSDGRLDITHWAHSLIWPVTMVQAMPNPLEEISTYIDGTLPILWRAARFPHATMPATSHLMNSPLNDW